MIRSRRGFTLLELLLSLVILATLTALSSRSIQQALFSKSKIQTQLDEMSQVRDALKIMERDVNLAFHYRDLEMEFREAVKKAGLPPGTLQNQGQAGQPGTFVTGAPTPPPTADELARRANRVDPVTEFDGKAEEMNFITMNAGRLMENQAQANFVKVGYSVKPCKHLGGKEQETKCLVRRQDANVEGDITKGGEDTVLLENVSEFKLRYFGKGKQDWVDTWSSKEGDGAAKGNYPNAVEISLTTENGDGPQKRKISMQIVAQVRFPNNPPKTGSGRSGGSP
jgi:prepilin-type N-terminal cleavage/methylation domain-containing protein